MLTPTLLDNRYKVLGVLGNGGFGETFLAEDTQMPSARRCVIKLLKPLQHNPQVYQLVQQRFQQEAAILEALGDGSNQIPRLYAYFTVDNQFYLVQEYIDGQTLTQKLRQQGVFSETEVKNILMDILPVLEYIHSKGVVHRDIKPDNIILRHADGKPVLIDFGAVKVTMNTEITPSGNINNKSIVIGTPGFMPPEQGLGQPVFASDLYSLALTAIYLLTGKIPQQLAINGATGELLWRHFTYNNITPAFADVLDKAIKKNLSFQGNPGEPTRYVTAREMLAALYTSLAPVAPTVLPPQPIVINQTQTIAATPPVVSQKVIQHRGLVLWLQGLIFGGVLGVLAVGSFWYLRGQTPPEVVKSTVPTNTTPISSTNSQQKTIDSNKTSKNSDTSTVSSKPKQTRPKQLNSSPSNITPIFPEAKPTETPTLTPQPSTPLTKQLNETAAKDLINRWLQAKQVMFAPPYDTQIAADLTTGNQYEQVAGNDGSINSLKNNGHYYKYGVQTIDEIEEFLTEANTATIQVKVTEDRTLFDKNGQILPGETDFKTRTVRYTLQLVDAKWKIASTEIVKN